MAALEGGLGVHNLGPLTIDEQTPQNYLNWQQNWALAAANRAERPLRGQLRGPCGAFIVGPSKPEYP